MGEVSFLICIHYQYNIRCGNCIIGGIAKKIDTGSPDDYN